MNGRKKLGLLAGAMLAAMLLLLAMRPVSPELALVVQEYRADRKMPPPALGPSVGGEEIYAIIQASNASRRKLCFFVHMDMRRPGSSDFCLAPTRLLSLTADGGWRDRYSPAICRHQIILAPSETVTFPARIDSERPCKVEFRYSLARSSNRLYQKLPQWLTTRLLWSKTNCVATTELIRVPPAIIEEAARVRVQLKAERRQLYEQIEQSRKLALRRAWRPPLPLMDDVEESAVDVDAQVFPIHNEFAKASVLPIDNEFITPR